MKNVEANNANKANITLMIPTYNAGDWIETSIKNILKQTDSNFKILFRDDCSTDNTVEILRKFEEQDSRVKVIKGEKNIGLGLQRKELINIVDTEYCMFLDDDDFLYKNAIKKLNLMKEKHNYDVIAGINTVSFKFLGKWLGFINPVKKIKDGQAPLYYYTNNMLFWWGALFKTEFLKSLDLSFMSRIYEDIFSLGFVYDAANTIKISNIKLVQYRKRQNSLSAFSINLFKERQEIIFCEYKKLFDLAWKLEDHKLRDSLVRGKMIAYIQLFCNFYQNINKELRVWLLEFIENKFVPFAKQYNYHFDFPKRIIEAQICFFPKIKKIVKKHLSKY